MSEGVECDKGGGLGKDEAGLESESKSVRMHKASHGVKDSAREAGSLH